MSPTTLNTLPYVVLGVLAGMLFIGLFIGWLWHICLVSLRNEQRKRELEHAERLKAIECGYPLDQVKPTNPAIAMGVGVPSTTFGLAFVATILDAGEFAWPAAAVVGLAGVICGTILALRAPQPIRHEPPASKPALDPDAFDVVSRRG
ncbi:MAG: hypothetical protein IRY99_05470 [Isosphaeraceae bacterium]|nr:hypothetical protein [Isosphaeraceae bacterium]